MADYKSIFNVTGKIGNLNMYGRKGKKCIRTTSSVTKDRMMTDPRYIRNRENMTEFGGASLAGKTFRRGLAPVYKHYADGTFNHKLSKLFKEMIRRYSGRRGQRSVEISTFKQMLEGLNLANDRDFGRAFSQPYTLTPSPDRNEVTLKVPVFEAHRMIAKETGATHFKLTMLIFLFCDHVFDETRSRYFPSTPNQSHVSNYVETAPIPVFGTTNAPITLVATLPDAPILTPTDVLVACVGIEYAQLVGGRHYCLQAANAMRVARVF